MLFTAEQASERELISLYDGGGIITDRPNPNLSGSGSPPPRKKGARDASRASGAPGLHERTLRRAANAVESSDIAHEVKIPQVIDVSSECAAFQIVAQRAGFNFLFE